MFTSKVWGRWWWWKISCTFLTLRWVQWYHLPLFHIPLHEVRPKVYVYKVDMWIALCFSWVSGCPESLGPTFPCHDSLLAGSCHSWLWTHHRMWLCLHGGVCINVFITCCSCKYTEGCASVIPCWKCKLICVLQPRQGQHEDDYTDKAKQQSGSSTPFKETITDNYLKSYSELDILVFNFSDQLTANTISALYDCLLLSGCLLSLLSCPDKNKHGKQSTLLVKWILHVLFLDVNISAHLSQLFCPLISGYDLFSWGHLWEPRKVGYVLYSCFDVQPVLEWYGFKIWSGLFLSFFIK